MWPYYYAGTMGLVQRDGINRLRHAMRYSREHSTICNVLSDAGWLAGVGAKRGVDGREIAKSDLIVVWGGNPVSTQVNVMTHVARGAEGARRQARRHRSLPHRRPPRVADIHLAPLPGTDGALACAVMHVLFKEGYADRAYMARYTDDPDGLEAHLATRDPAWAARDHRACRGRDRRFRAALRPHQAQLYPRRLRLLALAQRRGAALRRDLPAGGDRRWQYEGGGALYSNHGLVPLDRTLIEGLDVVDPDDPHPRPVADRPDPRPATGATSATGRRSRRC